MNESTRVKAGERTQREIVQVGWDGQSKPILRYRDELHLPDHMRTRVTDREYDQRRREEWQGNATSQTALATIEREVLSDGSEVWDVVGINDRVFCRDLKTAVELLGSINAAVAKAKGTTQ